MFLQRLRLMGILQLVNLAPTVLPTSRARTSTSHDPLLYALNLSHHVLPPYRA